MEACGSSWVGQWDWPAHLPCVNSEKPWVPRQQPSAVTHFLGIAFGKQEFCCLINSWLWTYNKILSNAHQNSFFQLIIWRICKPLVWDRFHSHWFSKILTVHLKWESLLHCIWEHTHLAPVPLETQKQSQTWVPIDTLNLLCKKTKKKSYLAFIWHTILYTNQLIFEWLIGSPFSLLL